MQKYYSAMPSSGEIEIQGGTKMNFWRLRRSSLSAPLALTITLLLAASPALAQPTPAKGSTGDHSSPEDDPGLAQPAPVQEEVKAWFYVKDRQKQGPVNTEELHQRIVAGEVGPTTLVWRAGMAGWVPLNTIPEFSGKIPPPLPGARSALATARHPAETTPAGPEPKRLRSRGLIIAGAATFGATWGTAMLVSILMSDSDREDDITFREVAWIPIIGPVLGYQLGEPDSNVLTAATVVWSLAQAAGVAMFIAGMVGKANPKYKKAASLLSPDGWQVMPLVGGVNGIGIGRYW